MTAQLISVSKPRFDIPAGAWDCHAHVFGPFDRFPLAGQHNYTPPECSGPDYLKMLETLGFSHGVIVQGSAHGQDNGAMLAALSTSKERLRGIGVTDSSISDETLASWRRRGVVGLRFVHVPRPDGSPRFPNTVGLNELVQLAPRMRAVGMHAELWTHSHLWNDIETVISQLNIPVVLDHMGRIDPEQGVDGKDFLRICKALAEDRIWIKAVAYRNVDAQASLPKLRKFHRSLLSANPENLIWGTDWPHVNWTEPIDAGVLASTFVEWTDDPNMVERILVRNPTRLYGRAYS